MHKFIKIFTSSRNSLMLAFLCITIIPIIVLSVSIYRSSTQEIKDNFIDSANGQVIHIDEYFTSYFNGLIHDIKFLSAHKVIKNVDTSITTYMSKEKNEYGFIPITPSKNGGIEAEIYKIYKDYALTHPDVVCVYMGTEYGGYLQWPESNLEDQYDPRKRIWYEEILNNKKYIFITSPYYAIATDDLAVVTLGQIIKDSHGKNLAIQAVDVSLDKLTSMIKSKKIGNTGYVILADANGTILANPKNPDMNLLNISEIGNHHFQKVIQSEHGNYEVELEGVMYYLNIYTSKTTNWKYISLIDKAELIESASRIKDVIILIAILLILACIPSAYAFSNRFSTPILNAVKQVQLIESGNYYSQIPENLLNRKDELGTFAKSVDAIQVIIRDLLNKVESASKIEMNSPAFIARMKEQTQNATSQVATALEQFIKTAESEAQHHERIVKKLEKTKVSLLNAQKIAHIWTWEFDIEKKLIFISEKMKEIIGLDSNIHSLSLNNFLNYIHYEDRDLFQRALYLMCNNEQVSIEYRILKEDQSEVWVHQNGNTEFNDDGQASRVLIMNHDITERKETLKKLREMNNNLREMVKEEVEENRKKDAVIIYQSRLAKMGQMIGLMTHQWKQPLNNLNLILSNIKESNEYGELTFEELNESIDNSKAIISQMGQTIDDFRFFFKPYGKWELFSLNVTIEFAIQLVEETIKFNNIHILKELQCSYKVYGYSNEFAQVIFNIIDNAKDALSHNEINNRSIKILTYEQNKNVIVEIINNGHPIQDIIIKKIFEPYFTTKNEKNGTGIGLYMSKMIIENHMNGKIECFNIKDGVKFKISIPINGDV